LQEELVAGLYREEGETAQKRRIQKKKKKKTAWVCVDYIL
jgi:hypothetical protein